MLHINLPFLALACASTWGSVNAASLLRLPRQANNTQASSTITASSQNPLPLDPYNYTESGFTVRISWEDTGAFKQSWAQTFLNQANTDLARTMASIGKSGTDPVDREVYKYSAVLFGVGGYFEMNQDDHQGRQGIDKLTYEGVQVTLNGIKSLWGWFGHGNVPRAFMELWPDGALRRVGYGVVEYYGFDPNGPPAGCKKFYWKRDLNLIPGDLGDRVEGAEAS